MSFLDFITMACGLPLPCMIAAPLCFLCWPLIIFNRIYHSVEADTKRSAKQRRQQASPPLPRARPRALSLPSSETCPRLNREQKTNPQLQSPLFHLPYELRQMIFQEVIGTYDIHLAPMHGQLGSFPCLQSRELGGKKSPEAPHSCWDREVIRLSSPGCGVPALKSYANTGVGALSLLRTCRLMYAIKDLMLSAGTHKHMLTPYHSYSESIDLLYTGRTFDFLQLDGILSLYACILPQRLNTITSIRLDGVTDQTYVESYDYAISCVSDFHRQEFKCMQDHLGGAWEATCMVLGDMKNLQTLRIYLAFRRFSTQLHHNTRCLAEEEFIFRPLRRITQPRVFEVEVDWPAYDDFNEDDAPFHLTRKLDSEEFDWE
jgi:hypothetical protein